ncbi:hypothetical protein JCM10213_008086 [Rhodosporidiobolus nylandii]
MSAASTPPATAQSPSPAGSSSLPPQPKAASPAPPKQSKGKPARRRQPVRRRGARADDDDESEAEQQQGGAGDSDSSASDSDFAPSLHGESDDEDEEDDASSASDDAGAGEPKTPATASVGQLDGAPQAKAKAVLAGQELHPSWSDMPAVGEDGASQLPTLDFANLSLDAVAAVPSSPAGAKQQQKEKAAPAPGLGADGKPVLSKKQLALQRREAKSAELKAKDPDAWAAKEKEMQEKAEAKRLARKEKVKEKKRERKALEKAQREAGARHPVVSTSKAALPSTAASASPAAQNKPARPVVPSRPSRTGLALGLVNPSATPSASPSNAVPPSRPIVPAFQRTPAFLRQQQQQQAAFGNHSQDASFAGGARGNWRGARGDGPAMRGLGSRGRGGRFAGPDRWTVQGVPVGEAQHPQQEKGKKPDSERKEGAAEGDSDDNWGRGEAKRQPRSSGVDQLPDWSHAGFEELEAEEQARSTSVPAVAPPAGPSGRGRGRGRGGFVTAPTRGGYASARGGLNGPPGAINPRYAHLPFHPLHRYPAAQPAQQQPSPAAPAPRVAPSAPADASPLPSAAPPAPQSQPLQPEPATTADAPPALDEPSSAVAAAPSSPAADAKRPVGVVRLPSVGAAQFQLAVKGAAAARAKEEAENPRPASTAAEKENEPIRSPQAQAADLELRKQQGASILYAADPSRFAASTLADDAAVSAPAASYPSYEQQLQDPSAAAAASLPPHLSGFMHQVPPHLQSPPTVQSPFIPRHDSPVYYPPAQAYYSPDAFSMLPSPGVTPPPQGFPTHPAHAPPSSAYFLPPRPNRRVEIKAPSRDGQSPVPVKTTISTATPSFGAPSDVATGAGSASPASQRATLPPSSPPPQHPSFQQHAPQQQQQPFASPFYPNPSAPVYAAGLYQQHGSSQGSFDGGNYYAAQAQHAFQPQPAQAYNPYAGGHVDPHPAAMYGAPGQGYYGAPGQEVQQGWGMY